MNRRIRVGVVGASGYTGSELLRLLIEHPQVELALASSRQHAGEPVAGLFGNLAGHCALHFSDPQPDELAQCEIVFFATPHGVCMREAAALLAAGVKIIDFSGDFRLRDPAVFQRWYGIEHTAPELLKEAVYGLPELHRDAIARARLIANPGCYPTAIQLGAAPLFAAGLLSGEQIIADAKSGVSGAGRGAKIANLYAEVAENFHAYAASGHRHQPEIEQGLSDLAGSAIRCVFVPHLLPMIRGIEATLYVPLADPAIDSATIQHCYERAYQDEPFVQVLPAQSTAQTRHVRGSNRVRIALHRSIDQRTLIVSVVEDNLIKGAAGQAVQSFNILSGLDETTGLGHLATLP